MGQEASMRDETEPLASIDEEYLVDLVESTWRETTAERSSRIDRMRAYEASWRDLRAQNAGSLWENSSNFHVPLTLSRGKAIHARLWQLFSAPTGYYSVLSRQEMYKERETQIKQFMDWLLESYANFGHGVQEEMDHFLWDVVFRGSGYLKVFWKRRNIKYKDVVNKVSVTETLAFSPDALTGGSIDSSAKTSVTEEEVEKDEVEECPVIKRINYEDIILPLGQTNPQTSDLVMTKVYLSPDEIKQKAEDGVFDKEKVEESLKFMESYLLQDDTGNQLKQDDAQMDGFNIDYAFSGKKHVIYEYYGPAYIGKHVNGIEDDQEMSKERQEVVAWIHHGSRKVLGWTYLYKISPNRKRPLFKSDFMTFPERSDGVGVPEVLYDIQRTVDAVNNLRVDAGTLSSIPMFAYRNSNASLKPHLMRIRPGQGIPVDDVNDIRQFQFPQLTSFGYSEEAQLAGYAEQLLSVSELQMGITPDKVGALRNATGSNLLASQSAIQLEIHFSRLARTMSDMLSFLFALCRERIDGKLYYRVTGEKGEPIFGTVDRESLRGDYDFKVAIDILSQSQLERQQQAVLAMQTLINPAFTNTGVVTPANIYQLGKNFLKAYKFTRVNDFISEPPGYEGDIVTPAERIARIIAGAIEGLSDTVRLGEDHEKAIRFYEAFRESDNFGLLTQPAQIAALNSLIEKHMQLLAAAQAGGNPNLAGMQVPREGFAAINSQIGGGGEALQAPMGQARGPVV